MKAEKSTLTEVLRIRKIPLYANLKAVDGAEQWQFCLEDTRQIFVLQGNEPKLCDGFCSANWKTDRTSQVKMY